MNPTADLFCTDCRSYTELVFDHSAGDVVCSECGLESRSVDETSEWRTFADDSGDHDPARVGEPVNPLLSGGGLSTVISMPVGSCGDSSIMRLQNRGGDPDRSLLMVFKGIANMSDRLSLVTAIKDLAKEIYKRLDDQKCTRGRNLDCLVAACIYIACRQEGKPRTVKEICSVANGATKKEIGRAKEFILKQLKAEMGQCMEIGTIHAGGLFEIKAGQETVQKLEEMDIRRSPISIVAAIIYMISQLSNAKKPLRGLSIYCLIC